MAEKRNRKKQILKHLNNVSIAIVLFSLMTSPALASSLDPTQTATNVITFEGGKEALNAALKIT